DLAWAGNALFRVLDQFQPLRQPAGGAAQGKEHREHIHRKAHGLIDDAAVEVYVGVELPLHKVFVFKGNTLQLDGDIEERVAPGDVEDIIGNLLDDLGARIVVLIDTVAKPH